MCTDIQISKRIVFSKQDQEDRLVRKYFSFTIADELCQMLGTNIVLYIYFRVLYGIVITHYIINVLK